MPWPVRTLAERFWNKIDRSGGPDSCWPWLASTKFGGYGQIRVDGKNLTASRLAWELENGPIPEGMDILHSCDNPPCCNPKHLSPGTDSQNMKQCSERGRLRTPAGYTDTGVHYKRAHRPALGYTD